MQGEWERQGEGGGARRSRGGGGGEGENGGVKVIDKKGSKDEVLLLGTFTRVLIFV